ncbi:MAG: ATP-binding protein [Bifidobacterium crudilactis]|jgi:hypothetical protein
MKKKDVLDLIRFHAENNDSAFRQQAYKIAGDFASDGDQRLAEYIMSTLSDAGVFIPQSTIDIPDNLRKVELSQDPLPLPDSITADIEGIINAVSRTMGIGKFLFQGAPGTGKTESAKQLARILKRDLYEVDSNMIVDSHLGQTSKNISQLFSDINSLPNPERVIILFDEIDVLALNRLDSNDVREMGRATSAMLKGLDSLNRDVVLIATTNLYKSLDKALSRRFDTAIDFNRYTREDLISVGDVLLHYFAKEYGFIKSNQKIFDKILGLMTDIPYPGDLKNLLRTSIVFSNMGDSYSYLSKFYKNVLGNDPSDLQILKKQGFSVREIEILSQIPKSTVSRTLQKGTSQ